MDSSVPVKVSPVPVLRERLIYGLKLSHWQDSNGMPLATNVKLRLACQKTALVEETHQGRKAFRCPCATI